jgi:uncharacterized protein YqfA (UPF0365 family)
MLGLTLVWKVKLFPEIIEVVIIEVVIFFEFIPLAYIFSALKFPSVNSSVFEI